jgi:hypothetical protein
MAHPIANVFREVSALLQNDANRRGNLLHFGEGDEIVFAGDIHGHRQNLAKIINFAALGSHPSRKLILHEIIHGPLDAERQDRSLEVLLRAVRLKLSYPGQVFFLLGNHDVAQMTGNEITKDGFGVVRTFDATLESMFGQDAQEVRQAAYDMFISQPLAARCWNGMFLSHSLPGPTRMSLMDWSVLGRPYREADLHRGAGIYEWTWGRDHSASQMIELTSRLEARQFILGHQPVEEGYRIVHGCMVILSSDTPHGCIMVLDAGQQVEDEELIDHIRQIAAL